MTLYAAANADSEVILFEDNFNYADGELPPHYWYEGRGEATVTEQRLLINSFDEGIASASTVWLNLELQGDLRIEFDAHVIDSKNGVNNVNFLLLFNDPTGKPLYETRREREDGAYGRYHCSEAVSSRLCSKRALQGLILTYVAGDRTESARFRLRAAPGARLVAENYTFESNQAKTYSIEIVKKGDLIQYSVDGEVQLSGRVDAALGEPEAGYVGFRTWATKLWIDRFKITRLAV
ncbi:MAG: DUF1961 family protein [Pseudomonadota bacterium]